MRSVYVGIAVFLLGFTAGAAINGWRITTKMVSQQNIQLRKDVDASNTAFNDANKKLNDVISKVDIANTKTGNTLTQLDSLATATNKQLGVISGNAQKVNNEISALKPPSCVFDTNIGSVYLNASKAANAGRNSLYGPEAGSTH